MIHVFANQAATYEPIQSLPDHSASVTAVKFASPNNTSVQLLSSGADKSIIFHTMEEEKVRRKEGEEWGGRKRSERTGGGRQGMGG